MKYFPNNTITHYTTKLSTPIILDSIAKWEVGLAEFQYPRTWNNIPENKNTFHILTSVKPLARGPKQIYKWELCTIPIKNYNTISDLVDEINDAIHTVSQDDKFRATYDESTKRITFNVPEKHAINFSKPLTHMLGYRQDRVVLQLCETAPFQTDLDGYYHDLYIYSDVITYQLVGDVSTPLLRVVATEGVEGVTIRKSFENIHYFPVSKSTFETVEIDIRTDTGDPVPFEKGRVDAVLHFKRKH